MVEYNPTQPDFQTSIPVAPSIPHSREAEEAVLGSLLINPNCYYDLAQFLRARHFYIHRHRFIFEAVERLEVRRVPIDLVTVSDELERMGKLADVGGSAYLTSLINQVPSSLNAESYGHIVEAHSIRRDMISAANKIAQLAYDENKDIEKALSEAQAETLSLAIVNNGGNMIRLDNLFGLVYDDVTERTKNPRDIWGFATGMPTFDRKTGGIQQGEIVHLVGGPAVGKTWLNLTWGMKFGEQAPGAIFSIEMKRLSIGRRTLSGLSGVSTRAMKSGFMQGDDWGKLTSKMEQYENHPVWIDDSSYDTHRLRAVLTWAKREYGLCWFILDYALLMTDGGRDETEQTKIISANLKRICHDLDLAGVVLNSVVKVGMENDEPKQADQRGSGQAIHDADVQLFLTKLWDKDERVAGLPQDQKNKMATLWCTKGRDLEQSKFKVHLCRQGDSPFWAEYSSREEQNLKYRKDIDE